ncbi:methyl-accepting chemotaxis protein [Sphingomonas psychrotolerans]|uniref:Methyl-accepting chemotaxis protein n=1 Tax=Sphingomonas psychrotolerans TaxID=1327635 RepID=A0ABU3MZY1_9SPHN|nr:methyl-accepting chemotaxis protein [Sphingomonas psychrotolerans]MDT8757860.1 methyl-accepting chemotaxis protein [Sphingomonas psychrotolerans]
MLRSLSISKKLAAAFAAVMLAAAATLGYVLFASSHVSALTEVNDRVDKEQSLAALVENSLLTAVADLRGFAVSGDPADAAAFENSMKRFDSAVKELAPLLRESKDVALLQKTITAATAWRRSAADPLLARMSETQAARIHEIAGSSGASRAVDDMTGGAEALREEKYEAVQASLEEMHTASLDEEYAVGTGMALMLAATFALWALLRALLGRPVVMLTRVMKKLAGGENKIDVPEADRGDELGDMARAVLVFRDAAIAKETADRAKAIADAEQKLVVDTLAEGLGKLSQGDLTAEIGAGFPADYAAVKTNFNDALGNLRALIGSVREGTEAIRAGSSEIATASEDLARRTESNAASLEETSAAVAQMDGRLKATAHAAVETVRSADGAMTEVAQGRAITDEAVQAMGRVSDSAKGIDDVIEGLDKIAFQTRVLAMNAAVEAGRAGEAGRGFAVVADLVSALAMRAEEEAKLAREQLVATQNEIGTAVAAVQKVDGALAGIATGVGEVHKLLGTMAVDNQAQASAVSEISSAVATMDQATQKNAAMVEETSAASRALSNEVATLARQAARFKVEGGPGDFDRERRFASVH